MKSRFKLFFSLVLLTQFQNHLKGMELPLPAECIEQEVIPGTPPEYQGRSVTWSIPKELRDHIKFAEQLEAALIAVEYSSHSETSLNYKRKSKTSRSTKRKKRKKNS